MSAASSGFGTQFLIKPAAGRIRSEVFCMRNVEGQRAYDNPAGRRAYNTKRRPRRKKKRAGKVIIVILAIVLLCAAAAALYIRQYTVDGDSMEPTLMAGDKVFYVGFAQADYGDIVIFDAGELYGLVIKRVVGLPGDQIEITANGYLIRNGESVEEGYMIPDAYGNSAMAKITVESGNLFVMGDNRARSIDSRDVRVGQISIRSVCGVVTRMLRDTEHAAQD
jgi:signal peptidase I